MSGNLECGRCGSPMEWKGPLVALTHTQCGGCGGIDTHIGFEEGARCNRYDCEGRVGIELDGDCSCHISPPCPAHTGAILACPICGWAEGNDEEPRSIIQAGRPITGLPG